jgi:carbonic anhydrase/acetyltransferase-like protein (isoleucine patch superfamily)
MASLIPFKGVTPTVGEGVFIADTARVIGDTHIGRGSNIWFGVAIRGDVHRIRIGEMTNIQENAVCHVTFQKWPLVIGNRVTIGHGAIVHGCTIGDDCLIGMGAVVLDGAIVQPFSMVAAGAVVSPGKVVESGWLWAGVPAKPVRQLTDEERAYLGWSSTHYYELSRHYMKQA